MSWRERYGDYIYVVDGETLAKVSRWLDDGWRYDGGDTWEVTRSLEQAQAAALRRLSGCLWCAHGCRRCRPLRRARAWWPELLRAARHLIYLSRGSHGWHWTADPRGVVELAEREAVPGMAPLPEGEGYGLAREAVRAVAEERGAV